MKTTSTHRTPAVRADIIVFYTCYLLGFALFLEWVIRVF